MNRKHQIACLCAATCWLFASGCQNNIHIRVERVVGVSSISRDSNVSRRLGDTVDNLTQIVENCRDARAAAQEFIHQFPGNVDPPGSAPTQASVSSQLESYLAALSDIEMNARTLRTECEAYFESIGQEDAPPDPSATLAKVRDFCETARDDLGAWPQTLKNTPVVGELEAKLPGLAPAVKAAQKKAVRASVAVAGNVESTLLQTKRGFGGFVATDVYPINPSDPQYGRILKSQSPFLAALMAPFWRHTSLETVTEATVGASGDSAVMLVMEHPGQVRVYQVSNDPAQLTRNIGLLINKATSAAAKYMSAGVAPVAP